MGKIGKIGKYKLLTPKRDQSPTTKTGKNRAFLRLHEENQPHRMIAANLPKEKQ